MSEPPTEEFRIEEDRRDGPVILRLRGELDLASADQVQQRLDALQAAGEAVVLDVDRLLFMDSSGLRVVLQAAENSRQSGWTRRSCSSPSS